jgi:hypothetical protein
MGFTQPAITTAGARALGLLHPNQQALFRLDRLARKVPTTDISERADLRSTLTKRGLALTKCLGEAAIGPAWRNPNSPPAPPEEFGPP